MAEKPERIPAEPQDSFNDYSRIVADQQLGVALEFAEPLDEAELRRAVAELIGAQPVLGCRFVAEGRRAWHEPAEDAAELAVLDADGDLWPTALHEAGRTLAPEAAHFSVTLVRGTDSDALAIRIDHTAADGQGAKACVELLAAAYSGALASDPRALASDRSWRRLRRAAGWPRLIGAAFRREDPRPTWGLPRVGEPTGERVHELLTLSAERFSAVRQWARDRNLTVNDLLLAAYYRALFATLEPKEGEPMVTRVSFDLRRYLKPSDPMPAASNLSSVEPVAIPRLAGEQFGGTATRVAAEMRRLKDGSPGLGGAVLLELLYRLRGYSATGESMAGGMKRGQSAGRTYPFLSNFGVLDPAALALGHVEPVRAVVLPVAAHPPFAMLGASTYAGELTLALGFAEGEIAAKLPGELLAAIDSDLPA